MGAVYGIKGEKNRIDLSKHIPLDTPLPVFIDASSVCNFHCNFCPHGDEKAIKAMPQTVMKKELALKCIDDLKRFSKRIKRISFSAGGEPLVNRDLPEMVAYAKYCDVSDCLGITTNGSLLTPDTAEKLVAAGLSHFDISIYGLNSEKYKEFSHSEIAYECIVENVKYLYSIKGNANVVVKISDAVCNTEEDVEGFYNTFSNISDKVCVEHAVSFWHDLDLTGIAEDDGKDIYGNEIRRKEVCPVPFFSLAVQANGIVTACCIDWKQQLIMGDAKEESLYDIWNGKKYNTLYKTLLKNGIKGNTVCRKCRYHELVAMDNIDFAREEILRRL